MWRMLLLGVLLLVACGWTGKVTVTGTYIENPDVGRIEYYAELEGQDDIQITRQLYIEINEKFEELGVAKMWCDFERTTHGTVYDYMVYCKERNG